MTVATDREIELLRERVASVAAGRRLLPVAGATKPAASRSARDDVDTLDLSSLTGILEYDPAELTVTALAATPVAEVAAELARHDQYLPFDPPLVQAGATLGGVVACATSGSGALRCGGVRDFVIGVRLIDGTGRLVAGGGRVVKNAAGFDLPKLVVGSRGRLGVIVSLSLKIFPRPRAHLTLIFDALAGDAAAAVAAARALASGPRELDAVDITGDGRLLVRLGGDPEALSPRAQAIADAVGAPAAQRLQDEDEARLWDEAGALAWAAPDALLVRVPLTARQAPALLDAIMRPATLPEAGDRPAIRLIRAANLAWISWPAACAPDDLDALLSGLGLTGVPLFGPPDLPLLGTARNGGAFATRVRAALDPHDRFLEL